MPKCSRNGCKEAAKKAGKCGAHYMEDYRKGHRVRVPVDLGENPGRIEFQAERDLIDRFHAGVPEGERGMVLRRALHAELFKLSKERQAGETEA